MCRVRDLSHWNREVTSLVNGFRWPINMQDMIVAKRHAQLVSSISTLVSFRASFQNQTLKVNLMGCWWYLYIKTSLQISKVSPKNYTLCQEVTGLTYRIVASRSTSWLVTYHVINWSWIWLVTCLHVLQQGVLKLGLNRTGHMSFMTGQDRTPMPDRSCQTGLNPDLYF